MNQPQPPRDNIAVMAAPHWSKFFLAFMIQQGVKEVKITVPDIKAMAEDTHGQLMIQETANVITIKRITAQELQELQAAYTQGRN